MIVVVKDHASTEIHEAASVRIDHTSVCIASKVSIVSLDGDRWEAYHNDQVQVYSGTRLLAEFTVQKEGVVD